MAASQERSFGRSQLSHSLFMLPAATATTTSIGEGCEPTAARLAPGITQVTSRDGTLEIALTGDWILGTLKTQYETLEQTIKALSHDRHARWNLLTVQTLDHAGALLLWRAWGERRPETLSTTPDQLSLLDHVAHIPAYAPRSRRWQPIDVLASVGGRVLGLLRELVFFLWLLGRLVLDFGRLLAHPSLAPWREISASVYRTGAQALGITALVGFLIGVVLSYLSGKQLKLYGADVFIINILGISIIRELGPLLAAILVAGRSGSSITAQLGVMRVTQELDALSVMGISQTFRLVLPKVIALAITMPLLVLWTSAIALIGGIVASDFALDIGYVQFLERLPQVVPIANLWLGLTKGVVFGALIALIACHFGLRIEPNTESLGTGTTTSVVVSITTVIVVDAIFAVAFSNVGLRF